MNVMQVSSLVKCPTGTSKPISRRIRLALECKGTLRRPRQPEMTPFRAVSRFVSDIVANVGDFDGEEA